MRDSVHRKQVTRCGPPWERVNKDRYKDVDSLGAVLEIAYTWSLEESQLVGIGLQGKLPIRQRLLNTF